MKRDDCVPPSLPPPPASANASNNNPLLPPPPHAHLARVHEVVAAAEHDRRPGRQLVGPHDDVGPIEAPRERRRQVEVARREAHDEVEQQLGGRPFLGWVCCCVAGRARVHTCACVCGCETGRHQCLAVKQCFAVKTRTSRHNPLPSPSRRPAAPPPHLRRKSSGR